MRLSTKRFLIKLKRDSVDIYYTLMGILFKPVIAYLDKRENVKYKETLDDSYYNKRKLEKKLYKSIESKILRDRVIYVFDIDYIPDMDDMGNYYTIGDLFKGSKDVYLGNYWYRVRDKSVSVDGWWSHIIGLSNRDIVVEIIDVESLYENEWDRCRPLYRGSKKVIKISEEIK